MDALRLFNSKGIEANEDGLWPVVTQVPGQLFGGQAPMINYMLFNDTPNWRSLGSLQGLFDCYHTNPILYAVVMIKAREYANMNIQVINKRTDMPEPLNTKKKIPAKLYQLYNKPNILQSRWEFMQQRKIFFEVAGNAFMYGNFGYSRKASVESTVSLMNVWPQHMKYIPAGGYFDAVQMSDIVAKWKFDAGHYKKEWDPYEILFTNKANTEVTDDVIFGRSPAIALQKPLSNIDMAYESRNVIMGNRGMTVVMSSAAGDGTGKVALMGDQEEDMNKRIKEYGTLRGQGRVFWSPYPLEVTPINQSVEALGLFDEIATDGMMVCHGYGVPEILLKLYIKGTSYENQEASVRRLYQGTLIPEAEDDILSQSTFLGLEDSDWYLYPDFSHVPVLQESEEKKETKLKLRSERYLAEIAAKVRTRQEYRDDMEMGPLPDELLDTEETTVAQAEATDEDGNKMLCPIKLHKAIQEFRKRKRIR